MFGRNLEILKKEYHYADYNDLLIFYKEEILKDKLFFKEILVDEYQDTNPLQDSILQALILLLFFVWGIMIKVFMLLMVLI